MINEPTTAKRDANEVSIDRKKWAEDQVILLYRNGLSEYDKLFLPYVVGKYGIDMTDDMAISYMDKSAANKGVVFCGLKELLTRISSEKKKLIIGLSSLVSGDRAENYLDCYRASHQLGDDEVLFVPVRNSGFLSVKESDSEFPINLLWCINKACNDMGIEVTRDFEDSKVPSRFGGDCSAMVFTFSKCNI